MAIADILSNAILCAIAYVCACHFPDEQRREGKIAASILFANWLFYILAWSGAYGLDISPASLINDLPHVTGVTHEATWAFADALVAVLMVIIGYKFLWAYALWGLYTLEVYQHYLKSQGSGHFGLYLYGLDLLFVAMVWVFMLIGGKRAFDHVYRLAGDLHVRGLRGLRGALQRSRARAGREG